MGPDPGAVASLGPSLRANPRLGDWLDLTGPGQVRVRSGKVELGQGIDTALAQIVAAGLGVDLARVTMAPPDTVSSPDEGYTSGSLSVQHSGAALRQVCAEVRAACQQAAAETLACEVTDISMDDGTFRCADGEVDYWSLATADILGQQATGLSLPDPGGDQSVVGTSVPRLDLPAKVVGRYRYIGDLHPPGLVHARMVRPPSRGCELMAVDLEPVRRLPGVRLVVREGSLLAVVADREEQALRAADALASACHWSTSKVSPLDARQSSFEAGAVTEVLQEDPDEADVPGSATGSLTSTYSRGYLAHASIGTSTALARWDGAHLQVWSHTQGVFPLRAALAGALGIPEQSVDVTHVPHAGCYGHNGSDDVAYDAAMLALWLPDHTVRVVWSRQDELSWAPVGPAMRACLSAQVDADGAVTSWTHDVWSNGHTTRPGSMPERAFLSQALADGIPTPTAVDPPLARGAGAGRNAVPGYDIPHRRVRVHRLTDMPVRTSALRSLGAHLNVTAIEAFIDEIAQQAGRDPVQYRLDRLSDPRGRRVLQRVAELAGWESRAAGQHGEGAGFGVGYARYKNMGAYCAVIAQVRLVDSVDVVALTVVVDVGQVVNPDGVANQIEGGAIQAASWTTREAVRFDGPHVSSDTWESYPILRFSEVPRVTVDIVDRPDQPALGAGEASIGPTAAAITNAVADALGVRVRTLPITPDAVVAAIAEAR